MLPKRKGDILKFHSNATPFNFLGFEDYTCEICSVLLKLSIPFLFIVRCLPDDIEYFDKKRQKNLNRKKVESAANMRVGRDATQQKS